MVFGIETDRILKHAEEVVGRRLSMVVENKRGSRSLVLTVNNGENDLIVKAGLDVEADYIALKLLTEVKFPAPSLVAYSDSFVNGCGLVVMTRLKGVQMRSLPPVDRFRTVSVLMNELRKLRKYSGGGGAGEIKDVWHGRGSTWKDYLEQVLSEAEKDITERNLLDMKLIDFNSIWLAIELARMGIDKLSTDLDLSLLHNDLNLANCIVTPGGGFLGIVDWSDAIYGEYLYDLARLRMNLEQSGDERSLLVYGQKLTMDAEESSREKLYYLCRLIEYLGIYGKYGSEHWFNCNQDLLRTVLTQARI